MPKFDVKKISSITGKQTFYQLTIDDYPDYTNLGEDEEKDDRKTGVLDIYEKNLQEIYIKNLAQIYNTMQQVANLGHAPGKKYHELSGRPKSDNVKDYEFKHGDLRVYAIKTDIGKIIILGGFKNSQPEDIKQMRLLKNEFIESQKTKK